MILELAVIILALFLCWIIVQYQASKCKAALENMETISTTLQGQLQDFEKQQEFLQKCLQFVDNTCKECNTLLVMLTSQDLANPILQKKRPGSPSFLKAKASLYLGQDIPANTEIGKILEEEKSKVTEDSEKDSITSFTNYKQSHTVYRDISNGYNLDQVIEKDEIPEY